MKRRIPETGDLGVLIANRANGKPGDLCLILDSPQIEKVGAWGAQTVVTVLCNGEIKRIPDYYVKALDQ